MAVCPQQLLLPAQSTCCTDTHIQRVGNQAVMHFSVTHFRSEYFWKWRVDKTWFPTALCLVVYFAGAKDRADNNWRSFCAWETSWKPVWTSCVISLGGGCLSPSCCQLMPWETSRKLLSLKFLYWWNVAQFGDGALGGWMGMNTWSSSEETNDCIRLFSLGNWKKKKRLNAVEHYIYIFSSAWALSIYNSIQFCLYQHTWHF